MTLLSSLNAEFEGSMHVPTDLYIAGAWRPAEDGQSLEVIDPSNGQVIARVADATVEDARRCVDAAYYCAESWASTPSRKRGEILRKAYVLMTERSEEFARLISVENGKSLPDARGEVAYAAEFFRWFSEEAVRVAGDLSVAPSGANRILVQYQPIGVSLLITPWNFPAAMATRKIAPALAAGCTCILKPAAETPLTAYAMASLLEEAGVPKGVVNVYTSSNAAGTVDAILADPRVRKLSFTGSTAVGRHLLKVAAQNVVSCSMELGGNAPFVVFDDADLDVALEGALVAKMRNGGEACTAANRFYVQDGIYDAFVDGLTRRMEQLSVGEGYLEGTQCGPLINVAAVERIGRLVEDAVARGAAVTTGGRALPRSGYFFSPTVLSRVPSDAQIMNSEIFGPVAPVTSFSTEDQAIKLANDTEYGLMAYVYTRDLARGLRVSERIESGMVGLNRGMVSDPAAPFGGVKQSGLGREGAHHGIMEFLEAKYIAVQW